MATFDQVKAETDALTSSIGTVAKLVADTKDALAQKSAALDAEVSGRAADAAAHAKELDDVNAIVAEQKKALDALVAPPAQP